MSLNGLVVRESPASAARVTQSILPALRTYSGTSVAIIGCHSSKASRESCEYDLLIVTDDILESKSIRVRDAYADLIFVREKEIRQPSNPEFAVSLSSLVPLRDNQWILATASSQAKKSLRANCAKASQGRLGSALKALARVDENISEGRLQDADFWLLSASYDVTFSNLYANQMIPSPSHLLSQMKKISKRPRTRFKEWADSVGLPLASRETAENRLGGLTLLYDILRTVELDSSLVGSLARYRSKETEEIVKRKAGYLMDTLLSTESFAFLGFEVVRTMIDLLRYQSSRTKRGFEYQSIVESLAKGGNRLISEQVINSLGLVRSKEMLVAAGRGLRDSIAVQAKVI